MEFAISGIENHFLSLTFLEIENMKKATQNQIEQLEKLREKIKLSNDVEAKTELLVSAEEILKEIDFMSNYYTNFVGDLRRYKTQKAIAIESALVTILDEAIEQYKN